MESKIKSSFIPTDTVQSGQRPSAYMGGAFDLLVLGAIVLFVASVALAIGVFLYVQFLESSKVSKTEQLTRAQEAFEPALIAELTRLDDRMSAATAVLQEHIAPSELFQTLEDLTLKTVSFQTLSLQVEGRNNISTEVSGRARSVNSIALQADLFGKSPMIASPIFSNITREDDAVVFNVNATINPSAISYVNAFQNRNSPASLPGQEPAEEDRSIPLFAP